MWNWSHFNCKFLPGDSAIVNETIIDPMKGATWNSKRRQSFVGKRGKVIAVSTPDGKRIR